MALVLLDQYQLLDRIGVGGMAEVWRATMRGAEGFERPVAIKRILPQFSGDTDFVAMFVDEAKIAVRLSHPNIVQIFDLGRAGDEWFIAMEFVHGKDLRAVADAEAARGQRVPLEVALHAIMAMCEALHHAHFMDSNPLQPAAGPRQIIHRDVSPQNVMVSYDGEVKVTDFGLAKAAGRAAQTQAGTIKGKLAYMSPEQLRGLPLDQRSDVFAVGIVLWELLSGERLFLGATDRDTIAKAFACKVPSLVSIDPTLDSELDRIAQRTLTLDRDQRYHTAQELHDDLEAFVYGAGLTLSSGSLSAYMKALFPQVEAATGRKRDPRAVTAQIQIEDDADMLESEPAPRFRSSGPVSEIPLSDLPSELSDHDIDALEESLSSILGSAGIEARPGSSKSALSAPALPAMPPHSMSGPPPTRASGAPSSPRNPAPAYSAPQTYQTAPDAQAGDINATLYDPDAVYPELDAARAAFAAQVASQFSAQNAGPPERSDVAPTKPPGRRQPPSIEHPFAAQDDGFDAFDDHTMAFEARFGDEDEQTPRFAQGVAHSLDSTHDDPEATHVPSDDEAYAAMAADNPPEEMLITRMVGPEPKDLLASRESDLADASAVAPRRAKDEVPTHAPPKPGERRAYDGFSIDEDEETTTGAGAPRRR